MKNSTHFVLILAVLLLTACPVLAEVKLPLHFSNHMVLQRDMKVPVWGTATIRAYALQSISAIELNRFAVVTTGSPVEYLPSLPSCNLIPPVQEYHGSR